MIFETIITSIDDAGTPHVTPFGVRYEGEFILISPYRPSVTLENILATRYAVMNLTDDVRVFAGALTNREAWTLLVANKIRGFRLAHCLAHVELELLEVREDATRPQLVMQKKHTEQHQPFNGFNRAQAAVIELAVLISRLHWLPRGKIEEEMAYLQIAIDKTAGEREHPAWQWLTETVSDY
ncbi:MAG: DUF447 domain-containing protein [Methylophilaceae bacterium]